MRPSAALIALALIGICCGGGYVWHDHRLFVENHGSSAALVSVEWDGRHDDAVVLSGDAVTFSFGYSGADVTITRLSDGALLFRAYLHASDFDNEGGVIEITVTP